MKGQIKVFEPELFHPCVLGLPPRNRPARLQEALCVAARPWESICLGQTTIDQERR